MLLSDHDVSSTWHPTKNTLNLSELTTQSGRKAWWVCSLGHEWECRIADRTLGKTKRGTGCPFCFGRKLLIGFNDFASMYPEVALEWHPSKNGELKPSNVYSGSKSRAWWMCKLGHEWECCIADRGLGEKKKHTGCPVCAGNKIVAGFNDLASQHPTLANDWHPVKNGLVQPSEVSSHSRIKRWWLGRCGHEWQAGTASLNRKEGTGRSNGCPVCNGKTILQGFNDLASQYPNVAQQWHPTKNEKSPEITFRSSRIKVWWLCSLGHEWKTTVTSRTESKTNCPICSGRKVCAGFNDLESQFPHLVLELHPTKNGSVKASELYAGGKKRMWWKCAKGHEWETGMESRTKPQGTNCPTCVVNSFVSKGEQEVVDFLSFEGFVVEQSNRTIFKNKRELDLFLPELMVAVEFNGLYYHSEEMGKYPEYHREKWLMCADKGIRLLQLWDDDWSCDPAGVRRMLLKALSPVEMVSTVGFSVVGCSHREAVGFLKAQAFGADRSVIVGGLNFKCVDSAGSIVAVLSLDELGSGVRQVVGYGDVLSFLSSEVLDFMLSSIANENSSGYLVQVDNCSFNAELFAGAGFVKSVEVAPFPSVMRRDRRVSLDMGSEGFSFVDAKGKFQLVKSGKLIWDAGKTCYKRTV